MPTYEYVCRSCGTNLEVVQAFTDDALTECPTCGGELRKVFGNIGIAFKGSGFYKNDSRSTTASAPKSEKSSSSTDSTTSSDSTSSDKASTTTSDSSSTTTTTAKPAETKSSDTKASTTPSA